MFAEDLAQRDGAAPERSRRTGHARAVGEQGVANASASDRRGHVEVGEDVRGVLRRGGHGHEYTTRGGICHAAMVPSNMIYFLEVVGTGTVRIGWSRRVMARIRDAGVYARDLKILAVVPGERQDERHVHLALSRASCVPARTESEYFHATPGVIALANYADGWGRGCPMSILDLARFVDEHEELNTGAETRAQRDRLFEAWSVTTIPPRLTDLAKASKLAQHELAPIVFGNGEPMSKRCASALGRVLGVRGDWLRCGGHPQKHPRSSAIRPPTDRNMPRFDREDGIVVRYPASDKAVAINELCRYRYQRGDRVKLLRPNDPKRYIGEVVRREFSRLYPHGASYSVLWNHGEVWSVSETHLRPA